jgi:hypothetical protein
VQIGDRFGNHLALVYNRNFIKVPPKTTDELVKLAIENTFDKNGDGRKDRYGLVWNFTEPFSRFRSSLDTAPGYLLSPLRPRAPPARKSRGPFQPSIRPKQRMHIDSSKPCAMNTALCRRTATTNWPTHSSKQAERP